MAGNEPGRLIFGRYSREQCGLPPVEASSVRRGREIRLVLAAVAGVILAGWLAGDLTVRWRGQWLAYLPARIQAASRSEVPELLARGGMYAASRPRDLRFAEALVPALSMAAERAPRRMGYYGSAGAILNRLPESAGETPETRFSKALAAAGVWSELGRFSDAFAEVARAGLALDAISNALKLPSAGEADRNGEARADLPEIQRVRARRLLLANMQAYLMATAPQGAGRNPERALHLAQLMLTSRDFVALGFSPSDSAAFLDTLATAWFAAGESEKAVKTQAMALGLADSEGLEVYLRHYDEFSAAARPRAGEVALEGKGAGAQRARR